MRQLQPPSTHVMQSVQVELTYMELHPPPVMQLKEQLIAFNALLC